MTSPISTTSTIEIWKSFQIHQDDLEFLFNHLLELETPQTSDELTLALIEHRLASYKENLKKQFANISIYLPKENYQVGNEISFPKLDYKKGKVIKTRQGNNPEYPALQVIEVEFDKKEFKLFAANIENHLLNQPISIDDNDPNLNPEHIHKTFGKEICASLTDSLEHNPDLIRIAGRWFPRSLLVDVNTGNLNLAEALLEEAGGGPLTTRAIIEQVELPKNVNPKLVDFSLDLALQEDPRFDEVGPTGETLWFLKRLEPIGVQKTPLFLEYKPVDYPVEKVNSFVQQFEGESCDEYGVDTDPGEDVQEATISLIYAHWRAGTLPLTNRLKWLFPTAFEAPQVMFTFTDTVAKSSFSGWVVRPHGYVYGLQNWYSAQGLMPGSLVHLKRGKAPGEIEIFIDKKRQNREELKTVLINPDSGIEFKLLKQQVNASYNERLAISVLYPDEIDQFWTQGKFSKEPLEQLMIRMVRELAKINPQGFVHAQELYAAINVTRRCPPGLVIYSLLNNASISHVGDLYFRLKES
jgi:hypothetical protein